MGFFDRVMGNHNKKHGHAVSTTEHQSATGTATTAKDPVCGMDVDINKAAAKSEYRGKAYYFCAHGCKTQFDKNPEQYIGMKENNSTMSHGKGGSCCQ